MKIKIGIKNKLLLPVLIVSILAYSLTIGYVSFFMYKQNVEDAEIRINNIAEIKANEVSNKVLPQIAVSETMIEAVETLNDMPETERRARTLQIMKAVFQNNKDILSVWLSRMKSFYDSTWKHEYGRHRFTILPDTNNTMRVYSEELELTGEPEGSKWQMSRKRNSPAMYNPYMQDIYKNGKDILMSTISVPVQKDGQFIGSAGIDFSLDQLDRMIKNTVSLAGEKAYLISNTGDIIARSDTSEAEKKIKHIDRFNNPEIIKCIEKQKDYSFVRKDSSGNILFYTFYPVKFTDELPAWSYAVSIPLKNVVKEARRTLIITILTGIFGLFVTSVLIIFVARSVIKKVLRISDYTKVLSDGNFTVDLPVDGKDEIDVMSQNLNEMRTKLSNIFRQLKNTAYVLDTKSKSLKVHSESVYAGATLQSSSSEQITASLEEMTSAFDQNSENTEASVKSSEKSVLRLKKTERSVEETAEIMKQISEKLAVIDEIAFKTKLLSINSSIEAARAGAAGKGFAVLSTEVRKLAEKVKDTSEDIKQISIRAVEISEKSVVLLQEMIPEIQNSSKLIKTVSTSSQEQMLGTRLVTDAMAQMSGITQQNVNMAEDIDSNAEELSSLADEMLKLVEYFKV